MSESKLNANETIEQIATLESVEEIEVLIEGDERKTVKDAAEKRIAELAEGSKQMLEPEEDSKPEPAEEVELFEVPAEEFKAVRDLVAEHVEAEAEFVKQSKINGKSLDTLADAALVFGRPEFKEIEGDAVEVDSAAWKLLKKDVASQVSVVRQRIGMTQPSKHITALFAAHKILTSKG